MKTKLILIAIICFNFSKAYSEGILDANNLWKYQILNYSLPPEYQRNYTAIVKIGSDTLISNINYKKIIQIMDSRNLKWETSGFIRETTDHKVFYRPLYENEKLLFDFAAKVNDSITTYSFSCEPEAHYKVLKVDSIKIANKFVRKINIVSTLHGIKETWIEGIGDSLSGFFHGTECPGGDIHRLECFFQNKVLQFSNTKYISTSTYSIEEVQCDCVYSNLYAGVDKTLEEKFSIYPNPTTDKIRMSNSKAIGSDLRIELHDINGKSVNSYVCSEESFEIDTKNLKSGIYILELTTNEGTQKFKVIKK